MTTRLARITWLTPEEGGRHAPPSGPRYSAPARFEGQTAGPEGANWSLIVDLVSHPPESGDWIAEVRFLVEEAPRECLRFGACFELYEGKKLVARGTILGFVPEIGDEKICRQLARNRIGAVDYLAVGEEADRKG